MNFGYGQAKRSCTKIIVEELNNKYQIPQKHKIYEYHFDQNKIKDVKDSIAYLDKLKNVFKENKNIVHYLDKWIELKNEELKRH